MKTYLFQQWFKESIGFLCEKKDKSSQSEHVDEASAPKTSAGSNISWLNKLIIHKITNKLSRNNTPSRAHLISKAVRQNAYSENQLILVS